MSGEEIAQQLWRAAETRRVCAVQLVGEPGTRTIHPYGVCLTSRKQVSLVCWQVVGFSHSHQQPGYRNLILSKIESVEISPIHFSKRDDFNAEDGQYKDWVFHI